MTVYPGSELELFASATRWKSYFSERLSPFISGRVLEVGAGIGSNTPYLKSEQVVHWQAVEPDPVLATQITTADEVQVGTIQDIETRFDTILYLDVLEHIEDDANEVRAAASCLSPGGHLIVLAPAHNFLFSEFDAAIGHYRRYNKKGLSTLTPDDCALFRLEYLDSVGLCASLSNKVLRQSVPTAPQIKFWDSMIVPVSRVLDVLTLHHLGKSIIAIWQKQSTGD